MWGLRSVERGVSKPGCGSAWSPGARPSCRTHSKARPICCPAVAARLLCHLFARGALFHPFLWAFWVLSFSSLSLWCLGPGWPRAASLSCPWFWRPLAGGGVTDTQGWSPLLSLLLGVPSSVCVWEGAGRGAGGWGSREARPAGCPRSGPAPGEPGTLRGCSSSLD